MVKELAVANKAVKRIAILLENMLLYMDVVVVVVVERIRSTHTHTQK